MKKTIVRQLLAAALLLGPGTHLFGGEAEDLLNAKDAANARGYGRQVSQDFSTLAIANMSGGTLTLQPSNSGKSQQLSNYFGAAFNIPIGQDFQVSLNGDGNSDDVVIRDSRGFVEYKADHRSIIGVFHSNIWVNLLTWTGSFWQLSTATDSVSGTDAFLVPWTDGKGVKTIKVLVLKSNNGFGRTISSDFLYLQLQNKSGKDLPLRSQYNGAWQNDGTLVSGTSRYYRIADVQRISLNGDGAQDDIKINNAKGYIELLAARATGVENGNIWINHFWWNPAAGNWYGSMSKTSINGNSNMVLSALDGATANKATGVISPSTVLLFTITKR